MESDIERRALRYGGKLDAALRLMSFDYPKFTAERLRRRETQAQFGGLLGHGRNWVSDVEIGRQVPDIEDLILLCLVTGRPIDYYFTLPPDKFNALACEVCAAEIKNPPAET